MSPWCLPVDWFGLHVQLETPEDGCTQAGMFLLRLGFWVVQQPLVWCAPT